MSKISKNGLQEISEAARRSFASYTDRVVAQAMAQVHPHIVKAVFDRCQTLTRLHEGALAKEPVDAQWEEIVSLSSLRRVVGGRFQLLRDRWVAAGLPLKEHRGVVLDTTLSESPELEKFYTWLSSQGFQVRVLPDKCAQGVLFELRKAGEVG